MLKVGVAFERVRSLARLAAFLGLIVSSASCTAAWGARITLQTYGPSDGLTSTAGGCALQDRSGYLLVCSEHGIFAYDGRRFLNLGPEQGLRSGGIVYDLVETTTGDIALRYENQIFIARGSQDQSPLSLRFSPVETRGSDHFDETVHHLARFRDEVAVIEGDTISRISGLRGEGRPAEIPIYYSPRERTLLAHPVALFSARGRLWASLASGAICAAEPGAVRCFQTGSGPKPQTWVDIVGGPDDTILARSATSLATVDLTSATISLEALPKQGGAYLGHPLELGLFRSPTGELMTQSADGLLLKTARGWRELSQASGFPAGVVTWALVDRGGDLWVDIMGVGLFRAVGYGHWENLQSQDGLGHGLIWQALRSGGSLFVATDLDVQRITGDVGERHIETILPGTSYALALDPLGRLWSSSGVDGVRVTDLKTGTSRKLASPPVTALFYATAQNAMWVGTASGLFEADWGSSAPVMSKSAVLGGRQIESVISDGDRGLFVIADGRLWRRDKGGRLQSIGPGWAPASFEPACLVRDDAGQLWVGGSGGLYVLRIVGGAVISARSVGSPQLPTNAVVALAKDRAGRIWVGTSAGISVYDGGLWVTANDTDGLLWNDISEDGIFPDTDGSVWISTSQGLSHLLDPDWLFARKAPSIVLTSARLGRIGLPARRLPYSLDPLSIELGTTSFSSATSTIFRYRLSGVDRNWASSVTGDIRYPFVPAGRHVFSASAYDTLTHVSSEPIDLAIVVEPPIWATWWAQLGYCAALIAGLLAIVRLRERASRRRSRQLEELVVERTAEIQAKTNQLVATQAELRRQATLDGLTGLLMRSELQRRISSMLAPGEAAGRTLVALLDIDHFKTINDAYGHLAGDQILAAVGELVGGVLGGDECAGRYGGEEILLVLDDGDRSAEKRIAALHTALRAYVHNVDGHEILVTCSIGLSWVERNDDWKSLIGRVDGAMYSAKRNGRDCIVTWPATSAASDQDERKFVRFDARRAGLGD